MFRDLHTISEMFGEFSRHGEALEAALDARRLYWNSWRLEHLKAWKRVNKDKVREQTGRYWERHGERINAQRREARKLRAERAVTNCDKVGK